MTDHAKLKTEIAKVVDCMIEIDACRDTINVIFCDLGHDPVKIQLDRTGKVVYCPECGTGYRYQ